MQANRSRSFLWMLGGGLLTGCLMFVVLIPVGYAFHDLGNWLNAPGLGAAWLWHAVGLPPHGEASFVLSPIFVFVQWFVIGCFIGVWRYRKAHQKSAPPPNHGQATPSTPPVK